jgi:hypothetical protein
MEEEQIRPGEDNGFSESRDAASKPISTENVWSAARGQGKSCGRESPDHLAISG